MSWFDPMDGDSLACALRQADGAQATAQRYSRKRLWELLEQSGCRLLDQIGAEVCASVYERTQIDPASDLHTEHMVLPVPQHPLLSKTPRVGMGMPDQILLEPKESGSLSVELQEPTSGPEGRNLVVRNIGKFDVLILHSRGVFSHLPSGQSKHFEALPFGRGYCWYLDLVA